MYPVIYGKQQEIEKITNHQTWESAVRCMRQLMVEDHVGTIQVGYKGDELLVVSRVIKSDKWNFNSSANWTPEQVEKHIKQPVTLKVPYGNSKQVRMSIGWGLRNSIKELFVNQFGVVFLNEGFTDSHAQQFVWSCNIPAESERALTQSYGCKIHRNSVRSR